MYLIRRDSGLYPMVGAHASIRALSRICPELLYTAPLAFRICGWQIKTLGDGAVLVNELDTEAVTDYQILLSGILNKIKAFNEQFTEECKKKLKEKKTVRY